MKRRVRLVVNGNVQQVGYRDFVLEKALETGIKGTVRNLKDETVEIIAEGEEEKLKEFRKSIEIKQFPISVEKVEETYSEYNGEFKNFKIVVEQGEDGVSEKLNIAARYLRELGVAVKSVEGAVKSVGADVRAVGADVKAVGADVRAVGADVKAVGADVNKLGEKIDEGNKMLANKIDEGNKMLAGKIDNVGTEIRAVRQEMTGLNSGILEILKELREERKEHREEVKELLATVINLSR